MTRRGIAGISLDTAEGYLMGIIANVLKEPQVTIIVSQAMTSLLCQTNCGTTRGSEYLGAIRKRRQIRGLPIAGRLAGLGVQRRRSVWPAAAHDQDRLQIMQGSASSSSTSRLALWAHHDLDDLLKPDLPGLPREHFWSFRGTQK